MKQNIFIDCIGSAFSIDIKNINDGYPILQWQKKELISISVTKEPDKIKYIKGEEFDATGMEVIATYSDGSIKKINDFIILDGKKLLTGQEKVTINYTEKEVTKQTTQNIQTTNDLILIKSNDSKMHEAIIKMIRDNYKIEDIDYDNKTIKITEENLYNITSLSQNGLNIGGGILDIAGLEYFSNLKSLNLNYLNFNDFIGESEIEINLNPLRELTNLSTIEFGWGQIKDISALENLDGLQYLDLRCNKIEDISPIENLENLVTININNQRIKKETTKDEREIVLPPIFIQTKDEKSKAYSEEAFTLTNCYINDNGKMILNEGANKATVKINGGILDGSTFTVTVVEKQLTEIEITKQPSKTNYVKGQIFDKTGMVVTATYNDGTSKEVTNYTISPNGVLTTSDNKVTISYTENNVTKTAEQAITVKAKEEPKPILKGDANGDSKVDFMDILATNKHRLGKVQLEGIYLEAADVNGDNKVDFMDILKINKYRLGKIDNL